MKIKSMTIQNFKGCTNKTFEFGDSNEILGVNGAGKTTIATAFYWLMANQDYDLKSNPNIRPIGAEEVTPRVEVVAEIDGKFVTFAKFQKCTIKKSKTGGADTVSLSNSYEVNAVEYGERDFKAKMSEYGIDFDRFLALSHPSIFVGQKSTDMRKVLFSMASEKSDLEIAEVTDGAEDVAELLGNYTMEEIKAMQNATIRKIKEDYGKDGEILRAKIEGLEMSKSDIDVAELELQKNSLNEQISANKEKQNDISKQLEEYQKLSDGIMELKFAESDLVRKANEENTAKRRDIEDKVSGKKFLVKQTEKTIYDTEKQIDSSKHTIRVRTEHIESLRSQYKSTQDLVFDENSLICSYCGQEYPAEKKEQLKSEFENKKQDELKRITNDGNNTKAELDAEKETLKKLELELKEHEKSLEMLSDAMAELEKQLAELPASVDMLQNAEYISIQEQIAEKEKVLATQSSANEIRRNLEDENRDLQLQLTEVEKQLALAGKNVEIDEQIAELRKKQAEYEQGKANAEKIIYQLELVSKKKNELLTEDVNKHFDIVQWQMFEYQKNGEYKECCIPLIDGKRFGESTNTGKEILAKLDIIKGLQKFYGQYYPVFLDGAESLTSDTKKRIDMDCQMIYLTVSNDDEQLRIEVK